MSNLFAGIPIMLPDELVETLAVGTRFRLERIVSRGHATPPGEWYDQAAAEWVVLLSGAARLRFADENEARPLQPGDWLLIPARRRHRVEWTDAGGDTIWLALHYD
jgi:cupin 2 domain-containing protein